MLLSIAHFSHEIRPMHYLFFDSRSPDFRAKFGWEYLPHDIETSWRTCHRRLLEYQRRRVWQKIISELMKLAYRRGKINLNNAYHDASVVKSKKGAKTK
jgi:hypothetical protein